MPVIVGDAAVMVTPNAEGFQAKLARQIEKDDYSKVGRKVGTQIGDGIGDGIGRSKRLRDADPSERLAKDVLSRLRKVQDAEKDLDYQRKLQARTLRKGLKEGLDLRAKEAVAVQRTAKLEADHARTRAAAMNRYASQAEQMRRDDNDFASRRAALGRTQMNATFGDLEKELRGLQSANSEWDKRSKLISRHKQGAGGSTLGQAGSVVAATEGYAGILGHDGAEPEDGEVRWHHRWCWLRPVRGAEGAQVAARGVMAYGKFSAYALGQAGQLEQTNVALSNMFDTASQAEDVIRKSQQFAIDTPFTLQEVTQGVRQLRAYGFAADDLIPTLTSVGDASSSLGLGVDGMSRMIRALGQIRSKGVFQADEAKQLTEAGIPAYKAIADYMTKIDKTGKKWSAGDVMAETTKRAVTAKVAIAGLTEYMDKTFGGGMEAQARTLLGTVSKLQDAVNIGLADSMQPFLAPLAASVDEVLPELKTASRVIGGSLGAGLEGLANTFLPKFEEMLPNLQAEFGNFLAEFGPKLGEVGVSLTEGLEAALPILSQMVDMTASFADGLGMAATIAGGLGDALIPDSGKGAYFANYLAQGVGGGLLGQLSSLVQMMSGESVSEVLGDAGQGIAAQTAKLKAYGSALGTVIDNSMTLESQRELGINMDALAAGDLGQIQAVMDLFTTRPELVASLGFDQSWLTKWGEIRSAIENDTITLSPEMRIDINKAQSDLRKMSTSALASGDPGRFNIDAAALGNLTTAGPEIEKLLALSDKQFRIALGVDASQVDAAQAKLREMQSLMQFLTTINGVLQIDSARVEAAGTALREVIAELTATPEQQQILLTADVDPAGLRNFEAGPLKDLINLPVKKLVELGLKPGAAARLQSNAKALLRALGPKVPDLPLDFKPKGRPNAAVERMVRSIQPKPVDLKVDADTGPAKDEGDRVSGWLSSLKPIFPIDGNNQPANSKGKESESFISGLNPLIRIGGENSSAIGAGAAAAAAINGMTATIRIFAERVGGAASASAPVDGFRRSYPAFAGGPSPSPLRSPEPSEGLVPLLRAPKKDEDAKAAAEKAERDAKEAERKAKERRKRQLSKMRDFYQNLTTEMYQGERTLARVENAAMTDAVRAAWDVAKFDSDKLKFLEKSDRETIKKLRDRFKRQGLVIAKQLKKYEDAKELRTTIKDNWTAGFDVSQTTNPETLLRRLTKYGDAAEAFSKNTGRLAEMGKKGGFSTEGLIQALAEADPETAAKLMERIVADPALAEKLARQYSQVFGKRGAAWDIGDKVAGVAVNGGKKIGDGLSNGLEARIPSLRKRLVKMGNNFGDAVRQAVKSAIDGEGEKKPKGRDNRNRFTRSQANYRPSSRKAAGVTGNAEAGDGRPVVVNVFPAKGMNEAQLGRKVAKEIAWRGGRT